MPDLKRPRGAPPGNKNAVKHGFYSKQIELQPCEREGLKTEIDYIRSVLDYTMELIPKLENPDHILKALSAIATSSVKLSFLLDRAAKTNSDEWGQIVSQAIKEVNAELRQKSD